MNNNENITALAQKPNNAESIDTKVTTKSISKTTASVGSMTLISRIFGFIRDMICAHILAHRDLMMLF